MLQLLYWFVVEKQELSLRTKLCVYQSVYVPVLTYGHMLWGMSAAGGKEVLDNLGKCQSRVTAPSKVRGASSGWSSSS